MRQWSRFAFRRRRDKDYRRAFRKYTPPARSGQWSAPTRPDHIGAVQYRSEFLYLPVDHGDGLQHFRVGEQGGFNKNRFELMYEIDNAA